MATNSTLAALAVAALQVADNVFTDHQPVEQW